ncbi:MAG TPA: acetate--CoA ligase family protein, partial [Candidatus Binatia bacterium]|nr:acetate--CoA ligase family protein [Candidatus Binatia bacterium]
GGIFTEVLKDYALRLAPLTRADAADMLSSLKAYPALQKGGTEESGHLAALTEALLRLSDLAVELDGRISAVDINPVGLRAGSPEIHVLDAKIHI